jgi:hypothetical protein
MADEIEYGEFWLPGGSDAHRDNPLAYCHRCGTIVLHTDKHSDWHAGDQPAAAAAHPWPWKCESCGADIFRNGDTWTHLLPPACDLLLPPAEAAGSAQADDTTPTATEPLDLTAIRDRIKRAYTEVGEVASQGAHRRWRMSIPAQPDRDSDLIISAALDDAEKLTAELERHQGTGQ